MNIEDSHLGISVWPLPKNEEWLTDDQIKICKMWAEDDRLWTTKETVEFNLKTFARSILHAK